MSFNVYHPEAGTGGTLMFMPGRTDVSFMPSGDRRRIPAAPRVHRPRLVPARPRPRPRHGRARGVRAPERSATENAVRMSATEGEKRAGTRQGAAAAGRYPGWTGLPRVGEYGIVRRPDPREGSVRRGLFAAGGHRTATRTRAPWRT